MPYPRLILGMLNAQFALSQDLSQEQVFACRWADLQLDGTIDGIDVGVEAMVYFSEVVISEPHPAIQEDALTDLEWAARAITGDLTLVFALNPSRCAHLPICPGEVLVSTVGQYLPFMPQVASRAIMAGADLAERCALGMLPLHKLSVPERGYREWVKPRLIRHFIYGPFRPAS